MILKAFLILKRCVYFCVYFVCILCVCVCFCVYLFKKSYVVDVDYVVRHQEQKIRKRKTEKTTYWEKKKGAGQSMTEKLKKKTKKQNENLFVFGSFIVQVRRYLDRGQERRKKKERSKSSESGVLKDEDPKGDMIPEKSVHVLCVGHGHALRSHFPPKISRVKRKNEICIVRGKGKSEFFWGPSEGGPAEVGPAEGGSAEDGPVEDDPAEDGPAEDVPAERDSDSPAEDGPAEDDPAEDCPEEEEIVQLRSSPAQGRSDWTHERKKLGKDKRSYKKTSISWIINIFRSFVRFIVENKNIISKLNRVSHILTIISIQELFLRRTDDCHTQDCNAKI